MALGNKPALLLTDETTGNLDTKTTDEIMDALETQARRRFRRACDAEEASYHFVAGTARRTDGRIRIAPMELSLDADWELV